MKVALHAVCARALAATLMLLVIPAFAQTTPTPSPAPTVATTPAPSPTPSDSEGAAIGATLELVAKPVAFAEGKASREEVYNAIMGSLKTIRVELDKAALKPVEHPLAVFLEADDEGFKYRAEIPIEAAPDGKTQLSDSVKLGLSPVGKAMRFEHRGEYDEIDSTYDAITAYLDEKSIDAQDVFIEEYLNETKTSDDPNLQVDILVLLK